MGERDSSFHRALLLVERSPCTRQRTQRWSGGAISSACSGLMYPGVPRTHVRGATSTFSRRRRSFRARVGPTLSMAEMAEPRRVQPNFWHEEVCIVPDCSSLVPDCSSLASDGSSVFRSRSRLLVGVSLQRRLTGVGRSALRAAHRMDALGHVGGCARTCLLDGWCTPCGVTFTWPNVDHLSRT